MNQTANYTQGHKPGLCITVLKAYWVRVTLFAFISFSYIKTYKGK